MEFAFLQDLELCRISQLLPYVSSYYMSRAQQDRCEKTLLVLAAGTSQRLYLQEGLSEEGDDVAISVLLLFLLLLCLS